MAVYDRIQRSLLGKCCMPARGAALTQAIQSIGRKVPVCFCDKADGFETGAKADFWTTIVEEPYMIVESPVHCGSYAARSLGDNGAWNYALAASLVKWFKWYFRICPNPDPPPVGVSGGILCVVQLDPWKSVDLYVQTGGAISPCFRILTTLGPWADGVTELEVNRWYCVELRIEADTIGAVQRLYVDGDLDIELNYDTDGHIFQQFNLNCIQWTLGMDCRTAIDCYCQTDSDRRPTSNDEKYPECYT